MSRLSELVHYEGQQLPAPKAATARNYDRPTIGPLREAFSRIWLGAPLMPWQRWVSDVMGELDPDTGLPWYDVGVVTVQRQSGKSHLSMTKTCERCMSRPKWRAWYTAQTGQDARDQFMKFDEDNIEGTPLRYVIKTLRGNGHEVMKFPNMSQLRPHPPTEKSLHGKQSDENDIDEAWAFDLADGRALMQAVAPTQLTRPWAQTWIWSAGGTPKSEWLGQLVADGRSGLQTMDLSGGGDPVRVAFFEWGIPDDLDLGDLEAIASYHPAIGHTMTLDGLRKLRSNLPDDGDFARAAGNRWSEVIGGAIPADLWTARRHHDVIPDSAPVAYGAARSPDGTEAALVAAAAVGDLVVVEVLEVVKPSHGAAHVIKGWLGSDAVAVDPTGPSATLVDQLKLAKVKLLRVREGDRQRDFTGRDAAAGVADFLDGLRSGMYVCRPNDDLDAAAAVAATRHVGDGGTQWAQLRSGSIATLAAASSAVFALQHRRPATGKPFVRKAS